MNMIISHHISRRALAPVSASRDFWLSFAQTQQPGLAPKRLISTATRSRRALAPVTDLSTFDLSVKNPDGGEEVIHRSPQAIMDEIAVLEIESATVLQTRRNLMFVIPAQAGTQCVSRVLDSRLRGNDGTIAALDLVSAEVLQTIRGLL